MINDVVQVLEFDAHSQDANHLTWLGQAGRNRCHYVEPGAPCGE